MVKLYFVRHGESSANTLREFSNSGYKHPLTALGIEQARQAASALRGLNISRIYSSPVLRAVQTAKIIADALQSSIEITEALREWSVGIYEGTTDPQGWELHRQVQEDWFIHHKLDSRMPGGESFVEIQERFVPFIAGLLPAQGETDQSIALVGHGGLYLAMLPLVLKNVDHAFACQYGFPYTAVVEANACPDGLNCVCWAGIVCS
jgi:probable phosphoglycerate mutase